MLQKAPPTAPTLRPKDAKSEWTALAATAASETRPKGLLEAVTELKVAFNPEIICLCGPLQNDGAHVTRGCGGGGR